LNTLGLPHEENGGHGIGSPERKIKLYIAAAVRKKPSLPQTPSWPVSVPFLLPPTAGAGQNVQGKEEEGKLG
jgi:hypothetical protein